MIGLDRLLGMVFQFERAAATLEVARNLHTTIGTHIGAQPALPLVAPPDSVADAAAIDAALDALEGRAASPPLGAAATLIGLRQPQFALPASDADGSLLALTRAGGTMDRLGAAASVQLAALPAPGIATGGEAQDADAQHAADTNGDAARSTTDRPDIAARTAARDSATIGTTTSETGGRDASAGARDGLSPPTHGAATDIDARHGRAAALADGAPREAAALADRAEAIAAALRGASGGQQAERAGIIASFMLNAAMLPGWPGERRFEPPRGESARWPLPPVPTGLSETDLLTYLANMGLRPSPAARLMRGVRQIGRRLRLLLGLGLLLARIRLVLRTLKDEFEALSEDEPTTPAGRPRQRPSRWQRFL